MKTLPAHLLTSRHTGTLFSASNSVLTSFFAAVLAISLISCDQPSPPATFVTESSVTGDTTKRPQRIVSLDFCADQYVLKLADKNHILALSPDAQKKYSYMRDQAEGIPSVRATAESILALQPDLAVRSYGGGPHITRFLADAGIPVLNIGWAGDVDGIKRVTLEMAKGLGETERGQSIVQEMETRIANLSPQDDNNETLYMTPGGVTSGSGSLIHNMLETAGLSNYQKQAGWHSLPLEALAYNEPDMIAAAFFDTNSNTTNTWSAMRHPIARDQLSDKPTIYLSGAWMACGAWFAVDAIEALSERRVSKQLDTQSIELHD